MARFGGYLYEGGSASNTTRLQEGLHCVCLAVRQMTKKDVNISIMQDADMFGVAHKKYCKLDAFDTELFEFSMNLNWMDSIVANANALWKSSWLKKTYIFHRNSPFMKSIYDQFNKLKQVEKIKIGNDKWNPGDVWASTINSIPQFNTLLELNEFISKNLKKGTLVSISLKKSSGTPKVVWQGPVEKPTPVGYKSIRKPKLIFSTGINIVTDKPKTEINFRSFRISKQADITGEILSIGGAARHGKVPATDKNRIIKKYNIPQINKAKIARLSDDELKDNLVNLWNQCGHKFSPKQWEKSWERRVNNIQDRTGYWQSIIHALELGAFLNSNKGQANDIINDFWVGATSTGAMSSEFIKVY